MGTHLPNVQSTVNITPITKMYTENLMRLFLNSDDICYLGHPTRHTTTAASAGSKKRSKPTKMIECAFFGREKKPMRRGPIWQIWWGHTPGS